MNNKINQSLRMVRQMRSNFFSRCTNSYIRKKVTSRCPPDASAGRSMVEMLGVLAIIGVLSVGAIAGYSKAMLKYKLNKQAESVNMLINNALQTLSSLDKQNTAEIRQNHNLYKLGLVPDGIKYIPNSDYLYDIFGNMILVYSANEAEKGYKYGIMFATGDSVKENFFDINSCRNIVTVAKENAANLKSVMSYDIEQGKHFGSLYGDSYCNNKDKPCLRNLKISDIDNLCSNRMNVFYVLWN